MPDPTAPLLLYDGSCGLCSRTVAFTLQHERAHTLRFAPLDGPTARDIRDRHPEQLGVDSVVWVEDPEHPERPVLVRSEAALRLAEYIGGPWRLLVAARILPRPWRDSVYAVIARHRHALFGHAPQCVVPPPDARARFLD